MTSPESKVQYEGAILNQLVKNAEKLAVIEFDLNQIKPKINKIDGFEQKVNSLEQKVDNLEQKVDGLDKKVDQIYSAISTVKWLSITIGIGIVINIFSQPILSLLFQAKP